MYAATPVFQIAIDSLINRIITPVFELIPSLLAVVLTLLVGYAIGDILDDRVYDWAWDRQVDEKARETPLELFVSEDEDAVAHLLATLVRYAVYVIAIAIAVGFLDVQALNEVVRTTVSYTPNFVGAIVVLLLGFGLGRVVESVVRTVVTGTEVASTLSQTLVGEAVDATPETLGNVAGTVAAYYVYLLALFVASGILAIPYLADVLHGFLVYYPLFVAAALVVLFGAYVAEFVGRTVSESDAVDALPGGDLVGRGVEAVVYLFAVVIALSIAGVDSDLLVALLAVAVLPLAIALALAVGIAFGYGGKGHASEYLDEHLEGRDGSSE